MVLIKSTVIINMAKLTVLIRGSRDCRKKSFDAYSSAKTESLKKDSAPVRDFSINRFLLVLIWIIVTSAIATHKKFTDEHHNKGA